MIIKPRNQKEFRHILAVEPERDNTPTIDTPDAWQEKRAVLKQTLTELLGEPSQTVIPEPRFTILEEIEQPDYRQLLISYEAEPGEDRDVVVRDRVGRSEAEPVEPRLVERRAGEDPGHHEAPECEREGERLMEPEEGQGQQAG